MAKRLWVTGYRAYELNVYGTQDKKLDVIKYCLKDQLIAQLEDGLEWLITGCNQGTDQWAAAVGLELKKDYPELKIAMMAPYADFGNRWQESGQEQLAALRQQVDFTADVSKAPYTGGWQLAEFGTFMSSHTDAALMLYDPEFPGKNKFDYNRAQNLSPDRHYNVSLITMYDLQDAATTMAEAAENDHFQNS
ncbi:DUF1273 domain-containing protein [Lacticaseibacillus zhaodongensis]|uniref:DUF1273 domain-containing protein n=1 Tax=Lacticaseibacillus zhaodongensis TaxID=2668065 RepID=UPI0012D3266E|nr:DUF1273 domain-containing protein [Lacticaseibacillus zhaodongensis]